MRRDGAAEETKAVTDLTLRSGVDEQGFRSRPRLHQRPMIADGPGQDAVRRPGRPLRNPRPRRRFWPDPARSIVTSMARQGTDKAQEPADEDPHEKARALAEDALGALAEGREKEADKLIEEAKKLDQSALEEVVADLDEDSGSDPDAAKKLPD